MLIELTFSGKFNSCKRERENEREGFYKKIANTLRF